MVPGVLCVGQQSLWLSCCRTVLILLLFSFPVSSASPSGWCWPPYSEHQRPGGGSQLPDGWIPGELCLPLRDHEVALNEAHLPQEFSSQQSTVHRVE